MKLLTLQLRRLCVLTAIALMAGSSSVLLSANRASAQSILQEQGSLQPMQDEYTFSGTEGQSVAISMDSPDFDTVLVLLDPDGKEIAVNDDYGRSLNSTIVTTLPQDGMYTVLARSFSGMGGNYTVAVREATQYEQAYSEGASLFMEGNLAGAIAAYTEAIQLDPNQPEAYMDRADARYAQAYSQLNESASEPVQPSPQVIQSVVEDYQQAADLYEQAGDAELAQSIRDQINLLQAPQ